MHLERAGYRALKSLATHKTDRNDARVLAHLVRTGFFEPVYVDVVVRARPWLADHCAQEAGRSAGDLGKSNSSPCGLARGPAAPCPHSAFNKSLKASEGVAGLFAAMRGLISTRSTVMVGFAAIDADMRRMARAAAACPG